VRGPIGPIELLITSALVVVIVIELCASGVKRKFDEKQRRADWQIKYRRRRK
jgi:hypothetical protein